MWQPWIMLRSWWGSRGATVSPHCFCFLFSQRGYFQSFCFALLLCCIILSADISFFFSGEKERNKEKRHFWQTAPQPKEALLRVMVARVILFVCAGATAPHVLAPLFVFFLGAGIIIVSTHCFCLLFSQREYFHCFSAPFLFPFFCSVTFTVSLNCFCFLFFRAS